MCDPTGITPLMISLALTAASTALSAQAAKKVEKKRNNAISAETARQDGLQKRSIAALKNTQEEFTPEKQQEGIDRAGEERSQRLLENTVGSTDTTSSLTGSAPKIVQDTAAQQLSKGLAEGKGFAKRLGKAGAFGEQQFGNNIRLGRLGEEINRFGRDSFNSAQILPTELAGANQAGAKLGFFADTLGAAGSAFNAASATSGGGAGSKLFAPGRP